jgi:hypothetical protein
MFIFQLQHNSANKMSYNTTEPKKPIDGEIQNEELLEFNAKYKVNYDEHQFQILKAYCKKTDFDYSDVLYYDKKCHCCEASIYETPPSSDNMYCSERCRVAIEEQEHTHIQPNVCQRCNVKFYYPYFQYFEHDCNYQLTQEEILNLEYDIHDLGDALGVCHDCFCDNSTALREFRRNIILKDIDCHHAVISTISMFGELQLYNLICDLEVWEDLVSFIGKEYDN